MLVMSASCKYGYKNVPFFFLFHSARNETVVHPIPHRLFGQYLLLSIGIRYFADGKPRGYNVDRSIS